MFSKKVLFNDFPNQEEMLKLWKEYEKTKTEESLKKATDYFQRVHIRSLKLLKYEGIPDKIFESIKDLELLSRYSKVDLDKLCKEERISEPLTKGIYFQIDPTLVIYKIIQEGCLPSLSVVVKRTSNVAVPFLMRHLHGDFPKKYTLLAIITAFSYSTDISADQILPFKQLDIQKYDLEELILFWYGWILLALRQLITKQETLDQSQLLVPLISKSLYANQESFIITKHCTINPKITFFNEFTSKAISMFCHLTSKLEYCERILTKMIDTAILEPTNIDALKLTWICLYECATNRILSPTFFIQTQADVLLVILSKDTTVRDKCLFLLLFGDLTHTAVNTPSTTNADDMRSFYILFVSKYLYTLSNSLPEVAISLTTLLLSNQPPAQRTQFQSCLLAQEWDKFVFTMLNNNTFVSPCLDNLYWLSLEHPKIVSEILKDGIQTLFNHADNTDFEPIFRVIVTFTSELENWSECLSPNTKYPDVATFYKHCSSTISKASTTTAIQLINVFIDVLSICDSLKSKNLLQNIIVYYDLTSVFYTLIHKELTHPPKIRFLSFLIQLLNKCTIFVSDHYLLQITDYKLFFSFVTPSHIDMLIELVMSEYSTNLGNQLGMPLVLSLCANPQYQMAVLNKLNQHLSSSVAVVQSCALNNMIITIYKCFKYLKEQSVFDVWLAVCNTLATTHYIPSYYQELYNLQSVVLAFSKGFATLLSHFITISKVREMQSLLIVNKSLSCVTPFMENVQVSCILQFQLFQTSMPIITMSCNDFIIVINKLEALVSVSIMYKNVSLLNKPILSNATQTAGLVCLTLQKSKNILKLNIQYCNTKMSGEIGLGQYPIPSLTATVSSNLGFKQLLVFQNMTPNALELMLVNMSMNVLVPPTINGSRLINKMDFLFHAHLSKNHSAMAGILQDFKSLFAPVSHYTVPCSGRMLIKYDYATLAEIGKLSSDICAVYDVNLILLYIEYQLNILHVSSKKDSAAIINKLSDFLFSNISLLNQQHITLLFKFNSTSTSNEYYYDNLLFNFKLWGQLTDATHYIAELNKLNKSILLGKCLYGLPSILHNQVLIQHILAIVITNIGNNDFTLVETFTSGLLQNDIAGFNRVFKQLIPSDALLVLLSNQRIQYLLKYICNIQGANQVLIHFMKHHLDWLLRNKLLVFSHSTLVYLRNTVCTMIPIKIIQCLPQYIQVDVVRPDLDYLMLFSASVLGVEYGETVSLLINKIGYSSAYITAFMAFTEWSICWLKLGVLYEEDCLVILVKWVVTILKECTKNTDQLLAFLSNFLNNAILVDSSKLLIFKLLSMVLRDASTLYLDGKLSDNLILAIFKLIHGSLFNYDNIVHHNMGVNLNKLVIYNTRFGSQSTINTGSIAANDSNKALNEKSENSESDAASLFTISSHILEQWISKTNEIIDKIAPQHAPEVIFIINHILQMGLLVQKNNKIQIISRGHLMSIFNRIYPDKTLLNKFQSHYYIGISTDECHVSMSLTLYPWFKYRLGDVGMMEMIKFIHKKYPASQLQANLTSDTITDILSEMVEMEALKSILTDIDAQMMVHLSMNSKLILDLMGRMTLGTNNVMGEVQQQIGIIGMYEKMKMVIVDAVQVAQVEMVPGVLKYGENNPKCEFVEDSHWNGLGLRKKVPGVLKLIKVVALEPAAEAEDTDNNLLEEWSIVQDDKIVILEDIIINNEPASCKMNADTLLFTPKDLEMPCFSAFVSECHNLFYRSNFGLLLMLQGGTRHIIHFKNNKNRRLFIKHVIQFGKDVLEIEEICQSRNEYAMNLQLKWVNGEITDEKYLNLLEIISGVPHKEIKDINAIYGIFNDGFRLFEQPHPKQTINYTVKHSWNNLKQDKSVANGVINGKINKWGIINNDGVFSIPDTRIINNSTIPPLNGNTLYCQTKQGYQYVHEPIGTFFIFNKQGQLLYPLFEDGWILLHNGITKRQANIMKKSEDDRYIVVGYGDAQLVKYRINKMTGMIRRSDRLIGHDTSIEMVEIQSDNDVCLSASFNKILIHALDTHVLLKVINRETGIKLINIMITPDYGDLVILRQKGDKREIQHFTINGELKREVQTNIMDVRNGDGHHLIGLEEDGQQLVIYELNGFQITRKIDLKAKIIDYYYEEEELVVLTETGEIVIFSK